MLLRHLARAAAALFLSTSSLVEASVIKRATTCNGNAELCSKSYGAVTFVGAHDSYAIGTDVGSNQDQDVTQQLNDGIRLLQVQAHNDNTRGVVLCHTNCVIKDGGEALVYFKTVKSWLDTNPNEVLTILIVNSDKLPPTIFQSIYQQAGLEAISFSPSTAVVAASSWPSLGEMIDSGKRVVTFLDTQADFTQVAYIIDEFQNVWETPFDVTQNSFPCTIDRIQGNPDTMLYLINHYLDTNFSAGLNIPVPDRQNLPITNSASGPGSLGAEVDTCVAAHTRPPNFMLVDFYEVGGGSVFQVAAKVNGVPYNPAQPIASPSLTNATTGSANTPSSTPLSGNAYHMNGDFVAWTAAFSCILLGSLIVL
jgi:hypothetical protein